MSISTETFIIIFLRELSLFTLMVCLSYRISLLTILDRFTISLEDNVMKSLSTIVNPALLKAFDGQSIEKKDVTKDLLPKFSRSATMVSLKVAVETVLKAFESLDNSMKALLFFTSKKGRLFERHLRLCLSSKRARTLPVSV